MDLTIFRIELLLLIASAVAILARRLRVPYTIGLVVAGFILASQSVAPNAHFTKELVYGVLLPPLIFEAAFHIKWSDLRPELPSIVTLATIGVAAASALSTILLHTLAGLSWSSSAIIGVVLSATDPVSVLALLKEHSVTGRVRLIVESESLFNDGTTAVLFALVLAGLSGGTTVGGTIYSSLLCIFGGIAVGGIVGGLSLKLAGETEDHLVEITVTTIAAFSSFLLAEHFHMSGVLATLVAGMMMGNIGHLGALTARGKEAVESFWEYVGFVSNSMIFLLIGIDLPSYHLNGLTHMVLWTIGISLAGRALAVYAGCAPFRNSPHPISIRLQHLLFWGGLRGALSLALVSGLDHTFPDRQVIVTCVFYAVAFSIIVQGLTVGGLIRNVRAPESV